MANTTSQINAAKLSTNFFIIREVYGYMASIDKIKKAKEKFYKYLDITPTRYDKIVEEGIPCSKIKFSVGFKSWGAGNSKMG